MLLGSYFKDPVGDEGKYFKIEKITL